MNNQYDCNGGNCERAAGLDKKTIYIAGPMTGLPEYNYAAFNKAEATLRERGWLVVNPANFSNVFGKPPIGALLDACVASELSAIPFLDAIYLLKGWKKSIGAKREFAVALKYGLEVIVEDSDKDSDK
ncbi:MAG: DUF4406 domain-containing protein [Kiritimatiellia bacterium]